jgi:threonine/homoserine/homoserine lactone efflux protein
LISGPAREKAASGFLDSIAMWETITAIPPDRFLAFLAGGLVVNIAPGQDILFATASGIQGGPRVGAAAGMGVAFGVVWHVALAALGLSALIAAHPGALTLIRYAGGAYLLVLAWKSWQADGAARATGGAQTALRAFGRGALTNVLNPKPVLFILAFLPQFVDPAIGPVWQQIAFLGVVFAITGALVTMGFGILAGHAGRAIAARMQMVNRLAAVLFAGLAARLLLLE